MDGAKFNPNEKIPVIPAGEQEAVKLKIPPKVCEKCGGKYIPTNNRQKQCPECRRLERLEHNRQDRHVRLEKARQPGEVKAYKIQATQKPADLPDQLYSAEQIIDVIRKYYAGVLVEKPEPIKQVTIPERLLRITARICDEICRHRAAFDATGMGDGLYDELLDEHCATCPLNELGGGRRCLSTK